MNNHLRCVGYVKPMDKEMAYCVENISIDIDKQMRNIENYAIVHHLSLTKIYRESDMDSAEVYRQMCEDAVHRKFEVLMVDTLLCFGSAMKAAADFLENVMIPAGFQVFVLKENRFATALDVRKAANLYRVIPAGMSRTYGTKTKRKNDKKQRLDKVQDLQYYEQRQREIFQEMLSADENFDALEEEMEHCRKMIKHIGR